tara:strand:+ start:354895 stop:357426 length:2532 start_codon:yes stop_codon:yes gene_type:complete
MNHLLYALAICIAFTCTVSVGEPLTLKQITAEQDWIARSPQNPRWLTDNSGIIYSIRREGLIGRDFSDSFLLSFDGSGSDAVQITPQVPGPYFTGSGSWNQSETESLLTNEGDLYRFDKASGAFAQLTKTTAHESGAFFIAGENGYAFRRSGKWFTRTFYGGLESQAADIRFEDAPEDPEDPEYNNLQQQQRDLFSIINLEDERKLTREEDERAWRDTNPNAVPGPFYLGKDSRSAGTWLSPNGKFMLVAKAPKESPSDPADLMPNYVTEDGYVSTSSVRSKVGHSTETPVAVTLLDLNNERVIDLPLDDLPFITDGPLAWLKAEQEPDAEVTDEPIDETIDDASDEANEDVEEPASEAEVASESTPDEESQDDEPQPRPVSHFGTRWNQAGTLAAVMLISHDNKDRWIAIVDTTLESPTLVSSHYLRDEAWIGWDFNSFGFLPNSDTLWYISEESGYGHLYTRTPDGTVTQRTSGPFEVRSLSFTRDGSAAYLRTNRTHPGIEELERLDLSTNELAPITHMGGTVESYTISPDEHQAIITYSNINSPPELYLVDLESESEPQQLTHTVTDEFTNANFQTPEIIAVPSTHTDLPIYTRVYLPDAAQFTGPRPLVLFSHGAGYLQHANYEWSDYSREHMYHSLLTSLGFIVVAPDFRASSGYGRDWRTAIYRNMGYPELEDFQDTIDYAIANYNADPDRVGIYGGSYGGFMTLMAMFLEPDTYKAGAALRSVTDWAHYNHGYTSNILNTPEIDPESFKRSSPIYHAEGLQGHLLMLHGLQDDNVVAQDIIRLSQRLIELEKENWELALAPIEPHGYKEPNSWLDQMRRIHKLFMDELYNEQTGD